jgi:probable phosphoglycerate mutase
MTVPTIYLVRHGETEWSRSGRHTGRTDLPLTAQGEADGRLLAQRLKGIPVTTVLSSPRLRAWRTAELAGFHPVIEPDLAEWDYGDYEGLTTAEIRHTNPHWNLFRDGCPAGESPEQIAARVDRLIGKLQGLSGTVLCFAHGHVLRVLAARWVGQPVTFAACLLLGTAAICSLGFDHGQRDEPAIRSWNLDR